MSEIKWTDSQREAINYHKSSVIVSAAAGSGKTAVLVERIIRMLDKTDIDRLLVVTFTQAASSQMRENIAEALEEKIRTTEDSDKKELYHRQLLLLPGANISTIHSFCSRIIKDNFDKLGLSPDYSLSEPEKSSLLLSESVSELIEEEYETKSPSFLAFANNYTSYKNDDMLFDAILSVYNFSRCLPYPEKWLDGICSNYENVSSCSWINDFYKKAKDTLSYVMSIYRDYLKTFEELSGTDKIIADKYLIPLLSDDLAKLTECFDLSTDFNCAYDAFNAIKFKNFPTIKNEEEKNSYIVNFFRSTRDEFKALIKKTTEDCFSFSTDEIEEFSKLQLPHIKELTNLVKKLETVYTDKKRASNLLDFNDLEHLAIKLLTDEDGNPTDCAKSLSEEFDEIVVDEYQDTNDVQEALLNAISNGKSNIFMVGDMKQSIYRFRNTAPELFLSKTENYSDEDSKTGKKIILSSNFRSRKNILDFSNLVFSQVMSKDVGEIEYGDNEKLYYGANYDGNDDSIDITVIEKNAYTDFSAIEQESAVIAEKINSLISSGFMVTDKKTKVLRPVTYKDFAILLRNSKNVSDEMATFLTKSGIPVYNDGGKEALLSSIEVQTVISLLKVIDNPYDDVALICVLRSLFYKFSDDLLLLISKNGSKNLSFYEKMISYDSAEVKEFTKDLEHYKKQAEILSVYELVEYVIRKNMLMEFSACMQGGSQRILNLRYLLRLANNYTKTTFEGLFGFLRYIESFSSQSQAMTSPKVLPETSDVVTITTMHKSKGLEYPIVIIPRLGKVLTNQDLSSKFLIHKHIGIGFDYVDATKHIKIKSPFRNAISKRLSDEHLSEELRILYVALTRAKEKLILIASCESHQDLLDRFLIAHNEKQYKFPSHISKSANSYLSWIMLSICRHKSFENVLTKADIEANTITNLSDITINFAKNIEFKLSQSDTTEYGFDENISDNIRDKLEYEIPMLGQGVFSKYSVSELKKYLEDETDYKYYFEKITPVADIKPTDNVSASSRGSAIHKVFELIDFKCTDSAQNIVEFVDSLANKGILSKKEADVIPCDKIYEFFLTEIGRKLKSADFVKREVPFNIHIADDFTLNFKNDINVQLQGVIDCFFKDEEGYTIIDFKSDILTEQNRASKIESYRKQLEFYTLALKTMYKDAPVKACIYFLDDNTLHWL